MSLRDIAANNRVDGIPHRTCQVCHALSTIDPDEANALRELLAGTMRYTEISEALAADEDTPLDLHPDALSRHARGRCDAKERLRGAA